MSKNRLHDAYLELKKYFGTMSKDAFLGAITDISAAASSASTAAAIENTGILREIQDALFSDSTSQKEFREIVERIAAYNSGQGDLDFFNSKLCFTDYDGTLGETYHEKVPFNLTNSTDQGTGGGAANKINVQKGVKEYPTEDLTKSYRLRTLFPSFDISETFNSKIHAVQVWPAATPSHSVDAEIAAVFLNSITSIVMSQAVPYVDILVSTGVGDGQSDDREPAPFSLGKFLGVKKSENDITYASFSDPIGASVVGKNLEARKKAQKAVASMEIFTTPQTLVDASPESIPHNELRGGPIDVFRPYMSLDAFNVQVLSANAGFISKKTADMKITLFDKGRLSSIAALVSPLAYNTVQFDITYGWSHPAGTTTAGRPGDAKYSDRIGQLIDAMKVTDTFTVVNNNFTFNPDGSVSIDLKLVNTAMNKFATKPVQLTNSLTVPEKKLAEIISALRDKLTQNSERFKSLNLPTYLTEGSSDNMLLLSNQQIKNIQKITSSLQNKSKSIPGIDGVVDCLIDLVGAPKKKGQKATEGEYQKYQQSRIKDVSVFIDELIDTPDPFLPRGNQIFGVNDEILKSRKYASLGKILIKALGPYFNSGNAEVIFVFGCLNESAAAVRDRNVSQFPILLRGEGNEVYLQKVLENYYKKNNTMSPQTFIQLIIENFIDFQGNRAYGLSEVFDPNVINAKKNSSVYIKDLNKKANETGGTLFIEQKKLENLKRIYTNLGLSDVSDAKFVVPKLVLNVDCRKNSSGSKNIVRVNVFDAAADPSRSIGDVLNEILRTGFVLTPPSGSTGDPKKRTPNHGERLSSIIKTLEAYKVLRKAVITTDDQKIKGATELKAEFEKNYKNALEVVGENVKDIRFMRDLFYKFLPTIVVGSGASGVIAANLSSQQNQALATQAISRAVNQTAEGTDPAIDYGMVLYPTQLTLEVFGSPTFKYMQRFFIDFNTNTSADNFYAVTGISYSFTPGNFKCNLNMALNDVFARTINLRRLSMETLASTVRLQKEEIAKPPAKKPQKKKK